MKTRKIKKNQNKKTLKKGNLTKSQQIEKTIENMNYKNGLCIYPKELHFENTDSNIMAAAKLLNSALNTKVIDPEKFVKDFRKNMSNYFFNKNPDLKNEYDELLKTNTSNGNKLKWQVIFIEPNYSFNLHIHPNVEYSYWYSSKYSINEYRYKYTVKDDTKIKDIPKKDFEYKKSKVLINAVNSMHVSYTTKNYGVLLALWSGSAKKVHPNQYPPYIKVPN